MKSHKIIKIEKEISDALTERFIYKMEAIRDL